MRKKNFFKKNRFIILVCLSFFVFLIFFLLRKERPANNLQYFEQLEENISSSNIDLEKNNNLSIIIKNSNKYDTYSAISSLVLANAFQKNGNYEEAKKELLSILTNNNKLFHPIARLRLASLLLNNCHYDEALTYLNDPPKYFYELFNDKKGDVFFAKGNIEDAKKFWKIAIESMKKNDPLFNLIQLKINSCNR